jgi:mono/diheme cytochrome c family protein
MGTVAVTGHIGGSLTHGSGYLTQYLPGGLKRFLGSSGAAAANTRITNIDSAAVYRDLILPVFESRCTSCHNEDKPKGGLRLGTPEGLIKGGDNGPALVAGSPEESELLRRITRAPGSEGVMPADGAPPLDVGETELIRWWIANGAPFESKVADLGEMPTSVVTLLKRVAPERPAKRGPLYSLVADSVDPKALSSLRKFGYGVREVAADLPLLQATTVNIRAKVGDEELKQLLPVATQLTWLNLAQTHVGDAGMAVLAKMPNLTRLYLQGTAVGDGGLKQLTGLKHLEYLNLGGTSVTDAGIQQLATLEGLRMVYLWQTKVTTDGAGRLQDASDSLQVVLGAVDTAQDPSTAKN